MRINFNWTGSAARRTLDAVLPPLCLSCNALVAEPGTLCAPCWDKLSFIAPPLCRRCGVPFDADAAAQSLCASCVARPPRYERARAAFRYGLESRGLILAFKHGDRTEAVPAFARWMARAGGELLDSADAIAPVPLHYRRLLRRRYNQSALLALAIGRLAQRRVLVDLLRRRRSTPSQTGLNARQRRRNLAGAIGVRERHAAGVEGQRILLIDDVLTTGATVSACVRALRQHGAAGVDVLTLARVVRPELLPDT